MPTLLSVREVSERWGMPHLEVNRHIRRKHIKAQKLGGWTWVLLEEDVQEAEQQDWFKEWRAKHPVEEAVE